MWVLRVLAVVLAIAIGAGFIAYLVSGQRRYLDFSWRLFGYGIIFALIVFALMILERVAVLPA